MSITLLQLEVEGRALAKTGLQLLGGLSRRCREKNANAVR